MHVGQRSPPVWHLVSTVTSPRGASHTDEGCRFELRRSAASLQLQLRMRALVMLCACSCGCTPGAFRGDKV
jgi:hypothetical protein